MRLTTRGRRLVAAVAYVVTVLLCAGALIVAYEVGQGWKLDRIEQEVSR